MRTSGRFQDLVVAPGVTSYGSWSTTRKKLYVDSEETELLCFQAEHAPWRQLFEGLDAVADRFPDTPVSPVDEADAIMACCWRYGSYAAVLLIGEFYPEFKQEERLSRIGDREMWRLNLEFSSGVAAWWETRAIDKARIFRRVRAALALLPMPWRRKRGEWYEEGVFGLRDELLPKLPEIRAALPGIYRAEEWQARLSREMTLREEANAMVNASYRNNNPIEDYHAGIPSPGTDTPGFVRLYADEVNGICMAAVNGFAPWIATRDWLEARGERDLMWVLACQLLAWPHQWSLTAETRPVYFETSVDGESVLPRVRRLAARYPLIYGSCLHL